MLNEGSFKKFLLNGGFINSTVLYIGKPVSKDNFSLSNTLGSLVLKDISYSLFI